MFWFSLQLLSETFLILRRIQRDIITMYIGLYVKYRYCCQILMKLEFSRQIFEKYSNIKFHENPYSGNRVVPCGQTDRHDEANSRFTHYLRTRPTSIRNRVNFTGTIQLRCVQMPVLIAAKQTQPAPSAQDMTHTVHSSQPNIPVTQQSSLTNSLVRLRLSYCNEWPARSIPVTGDSNAIRNMRIATKIFKNAPIIFTMSVCLSGCRI